MSRSAERLLYATIIALSVAALGLFAVLPELALVTTLVYQGF